MDCNSLRESSLESKTFAEIILGSNLGKNLKLIFPHAFDRDGHCWLRFSS